MSQAIAIIGVACRFPDARGPGELWQSVLSQRRAFRRIPAVRLRLEDYFSEGGRAPDSTYSSEAAVIEGYEFDRVRFRVGSRAFQAADMAHWLALDVASEALHDAGYPGGEGLDRDAAGVLVGNSLTGEFTRAGLMRLRWPYVRRRVEAALAGEGWSRERRSAFLAGLEASYKEPFPETTEESLAGGLSNTIAGRICNYFDLHGGGYTVDGACSSSLLAVANACSALAAGDLDVALAGGVDLSLDPFELVGFARTQALAAGEMRIYDRRSAGFLPGEGCGFVVLARHRDAVAGGRRIHALIRGWGVASDGGGGLTRPEVEGQCHALRRAYRRAGLGIDTVPLFEGHGTGTAVGDATELAALNRARREAAGGSPADTAAIGSVKANIGHTKAAAGVAGLIKACLALEHQVLPPTTGCEDPHPELAGGGSSLRALGRAELWPEDAPLAAGVSAMGFGGINCHVVLGADAPRRRHGWSAAELGARAAPQDAELLLLAAPSRGELAAQVERLARRAGGLSRAEVGDLGAHLARTLPVERAYRAALVAEGPRQLAGRLEVLRSWLEEGVEDRLDAGEGVFLGRSGEPPRVGFLFPGQGSPSRLGGGLWRRRFAGVDALYAASALPESGDGVDTAVAQPALCTACLAALAVLGRLGVEAKAAVGHSLGELAALCWAGALEADALLAVAAERGRAMAECGRDSGPAGAMASLEAGAAEVEELIAGLAVGVTGYNSPRQTVISGVEPEVERAVAAARARGLRAVRLPVSHAFHSPLVAAAAPRLAAALAAAEVRPLRRRVASTVTGDWLDGGTDLRRLLERQVTSPVRFIEAVEKAAAEVDLFLEVGPGEVLTGMARRISPRPVYSLDAGGSSLAGLLRAAGALFAAGAPIAAEELFAGRFVRPIDLDAEPRFLANPCESAPVSDAAEAAAPAAAAGPRRAAPAAGESVAAAEVVRELIARRTELPSSVVSDDSRLLSDLHLSSIAVGEIVTDAARRLGLPPPSAPTEYANATLAEVTRSLEELAATGHAEARPEDVLPPGIDSWVRAFTVELVERPLGERRGPAASASGEGPWRVFAPAGDPFGAALERALAAAGAPAAGAPAAGAPAAAGPGVALYLPADDGDRHLDLLLAAARAVARRGTFLLVHHGGGAAGFARTLHLERPEVAVAVVELPADLAPGEAEPWSARAAREAGIGRGYREARFDRDGRRFQPVLRLLDGPGAEVREAGPLPAGPLGADDVVVVSGGGKGIGAECALALARRWGVRLALLGRSLPESDGELSANLERFAALGVVFRYLRADVTDAGEVREAVAAARAALGEPTAVLHSAGANVPRLIEVLERADFERTLAPKVGGLRNLLAAVDAAKVRLVVGFGSIIARTGLAGEADYAYANERLRRELEDHGRGHPGCRCLCLEWSVWSGVGMGARLSRLEALGRRGITPVTPERGVEALVSLLERPPASGGGREPVAVVVAGRFGEPPTLEVERPELPLLRFLERPRVYLPGVELVADCTVSSDTDPYLADHVYDGERLFPAVMGLEAMAQAWHALTGRAAPPVFHRVRFERPISVPSGETVVLRTAALARRDGTVEVALRSDRTGFRLDYFRAVLAGAETGGGSSPSHVRPPPGGDGAFLPLEPLADLYGRVLFQGGRFRRLAGYRHLRATECLAEISPGGREPWFSSYLPAGLRLADPAMRDASIHCVQASIPHATVLPVGVERLQVSSAGARAQGAWRVTARELSREGKTLVYDVEVRDPEGGLVERWKKLELRIVDEPREAPVLATPLVGPYLERRLQDFLPGAPVAVTVERHRCARRRAGGDRVLRELLGPAAEIRRRPDGRPEAGGGLGVALAYSGDLVLAVAGRGTVGCDVERVERRPPEVWRDLLGRHAGLAELVVRESGEDRDAAATRVWTVLESAKKAGCGADVPLVLSGAAADGWIVFSSGRHLAATVLLPAADGAAGGAAGRRAGGLAFAVMVERGGAGAARRPLCHLEDVST